MAMFLDYKPTRYEGKGFLRNLNIRIHRDITGDRCGLCVINSYSITCYNIDAIVIHFC